MEMFHKNMDGGKTVSVKTLLWVANNKKKKNAANTIPDPGLFPHTVLLVIVCNCTEHNLERQI